MTSKLTVREGCLLSLMAALMFASKLALAAIPNVHLNAVFIIVAAVFFSWRSLYTVGVYILLEGIFFGFGLWWISYLYAWPLLCVAAVLLRRCRSPLLWAVLAGAHGLCFGALCSIPYLFIGGWTLAFSTWISGIPFDLAHCAGNFMLVLVLFNPLRKVTALLLKNPAE